MSQSIFRHSGLTQKSDLMKYGRKEMHLHPRWRRKRRICAHTHTPHVKKSNQSALQSSYSAFPQLLEGPVCVFCFWPARIERAAHKPEWMRCIQRVRSRFVEIAAPWCVAYPARPRTPVCPFIIVRRCRALFLPASQPAQIVILIDKVHAVNYLEITRCRNKPFMSPPAP